MAKRGILEHEKTFALADRLGIMECYAVGILEVFWHWVAKYRPHGDLTGAKPQMMGRAIRYTGDINDLWASLIACGFIEPLPDGRLIVHDWSEHADNSVHQLLKKRRELFADGNSPFTRNKSREVNDSPTVHELVEPEDTNGSQTVQHSQSQSQSQSQNPEPRPEPEPESCRRAVIEFPTSGGNALAAKAQLNPFEAFEQIWEAYPDAGRSRKEVSRAVFVGITAQFKGKEPELLAKILDGIATWQKSDLWNRGAVHGIRNWLSERLWVETPPPPQAIDSNSQRRRNERTATTFRRNDAREPEAACEHCADTGTVIKPEIMADLLNPKWCEMTEAEQRMPCPHCRGAK